MTDDDIRAALIEKLRREEQIARRTLDDEKLALVNVGRAEEVHKVAYAASVEAQRVRNATKRALKELGWEEGGND